MARYTELLVEAIEGTIRLVLGESVTEWIHRLMERNVSLKREDAGEKIGVFYAFLAKLLGSEGAHVIHNTSLKRLILKLRREYMEVLTYFSFLSNSMKLSSSFWFHLWSKNVQCATDGFKRHVKRLLCALSDSDFIQVKSN